MDTTPSLSQSLSTATLPLVLAVLTILFGQGMGIVSGLNEDTIKSRLSASAAEVRETVYKSDDAAIKAVLDMSWVYMQRAHLHAGGMGTTALVLIPWLCLLGASQRVTVAIGVGLGAGGFGYSIFWMWAGFRAPGPRLHNRIHGCTGVRRDAFGPVRSTGGVRGQGWLNRDLEPESTSRVGSGIRPIDTLSTICCCRHVPSWKTSVGHFQAQTRTIRERYQNESHFVPSPPSTR